MIEKTDAVVLKSMKFGDTSKIVTFYTRRYGKLNGIAKGARQPKSKFGASLQPLAVVSLILYKKETRDLHLISQCDIKTSFKNLQGDFDRMGVGLSLLELVNRLTSHEEQHASLFDLIVTSLAVIDASDGNVRLVFPAFQLRCAGLLGFAPNFAVCLECKRSLPDVTMKEGMVFSPERGGIICGECREKSNSGEPDAVRAVHGLSERGMPGARAGTGRRMTPQAVHFLDDLCSVPMEDVCGLSIEEQFGNEIRETIRLYYRYHFEDLRPLKAPEIFGTF